MESGTTFNMPSLIPPQNIEVFGIYGNQYNCDPSACFVTYGNNRKNHYLKLEELKTLELPELSVRDQNQLDEMAKAFKPKLIEILKKHQSSFQEFYDQSIFKEETGFEEFFIWYYHFLYTRTTDLLAEREIIDIPKEGIYRVKLLRN